MSKVFASSNIYILRLITLYKWLFREPERCNADSLQCNLQHCSFPQNHKGKQTPQRKSIHVQLKNTINSSTAAHVLVSLVSELFLKVLLMIPCLCLFDKNSALSPIYLTCFPLIVRGKKHRSQQTVCNLFLAFIQISC